MNDPISALSSILTIVAILFGLWYPDIRAAIDLKLSNHSDDNKPLERTIKNAMNYKAYPLLIINVITLLIFLPDGVKILYDSFQLALSGTPYVYDSSRAAFIVMLLLLAGLSIILTNDKKKLKDKLPSNPPKGKKPLQ